MGGDETDSDSFSAKCFTLALASSRLTISFLLSLKYNADKLLLLTVHSSNRVVSPAAQMHMDT